MIFEGKIIPCKYEDIHENPDKSYFLTLTRAEFVERKSKFGFPERAVAEAVDAKQYPILSIYPDLLFMSVNEVGWHPKKEAWQAQVDIGLNDIMRVFTVVTAVFLPLTLIAGWYGMNFKIMPELSWTLGYPFAFFLSFVVLVVSLWYLPAFAIRRPVI